MEINSPAHPRCLCGCLCFKNRHGFIGAGHLGWLALVVCCFSLSMGQHFFQVGAARDAGEQAHLGCERTHWARSYEKTTVLSDVERSFLVKIPEQWSRCWLTWNKVTLPTPSKVFHPKPLGQRCSGKGCWVRPPPLDGQLQPLKCRIEKILHFTIYVMYGGKTLFT